MVLFSVLCAVTFFVVAVKFATPLSCLESRWEEFTVFLLILLIYALMLLFYCKDIIIARNVIFGFVGSGIIVAALALFDIGINGLVYFISILAIAIVSTRRSRCSGTASADLW